jgi:hypothetical protein
VDRDRPQLNVKTKKFNGESISNWFFGEAWEVRGPQDAKRIGQSVKEKSSKYIAPKFNKIPPSATTSFGAGCPFLIRYFMHGVWDAFGLSIDAPVKCASL